MSESAALIARHRAVALFGGAGLALVAAQALLPALPSVTARQVAVAAEHRGGEAGSAAAFLVAGVLIALGVAAANRLAVDRGRALTRIGLIVTGIGALWPVAGRASFNAILLAVTDNGVSRSAAVSVVHSVSGSSAFAMFLPLLACFAFGPMLFALGLRRAGLLPVWPAILWLAGVIVVNGAEGSSRPAATAGMVAVAAALAWIGAGVAKGPSADVVPAESTVAQPAMIR